MSNTFKFSPITTEQVIETISQLHPKRSPGIDSISISLLKNANDAIAQPHVFKLFLRTATFPDDWKSQKFSLVLVLKMTVENTYNSL